jgi:hypothetical protein
MNHEEIVTRKLTARAVTETEIPHIGASLTQIGRRAEMRTAASCFSPFSLTSFGKTSNVEVVRIA